MALNNIHLRKLLKTLYLPPNRQISAIRSDIREDIAREGGGAGGGGDFYGPFWYDAKQHVFGLTDLHDAVDERIDANPGRANLYPRLRDGFLLWWNERRRWTNEPFQPGRVEKARFRFPGLNAVVKVDNILSVLDARDDDHFVYPYFAPEPTLNEEAARLALWLLSQALPQIQPNELRILDVIRGATFSLDRNPLRGDEEAVFRRRYSALLRERGRLRAEYD